MEYANFQAIKVELGYFRCAKMHIWWLKIAIVWAISVDDCR